MLFRFIKTATQTSLGLLATQKLAQADLPWAFIEAQLNEALHNSFGAKDILHSLDQQTIHCILTPLNFQAYIRFVHGQIILKPGAYPNADAHIHISCLDNLSHWFQGELKLHHTLKGNFETLLAFQHLLNTLDIELGDFLAPHLGPQLTALVVNGLQSFKDHLTEVVQKFQHMSKDFFQHEQNLFVRPQDLNQLRTQLREKSFDVERLEARIQRLEARAP